MCEAVRDRQPASSAAAAKALLELVRRELRARTAAAHAAYDQRRHLERALARSIRPRRARPGRPTPAASRRPARASPARGEALELTARCPCAGDERPPHRRSSIRAPEARRCTRQAASCPASSTAAQCNAALCGRWYRELAASDLPRAHQLTAVESVAPMAAQVRARRRTRCGTIRAAPRPRRRQGRHGRSGCRRVTAEPGLALGARTIDRGLSAVAAEAASSRALLDVGAGPRLEVLLFLQTLVARRGGFRQPRALLAALVRLVQEHGGREGE